MLDDSAVIAVINVDRFRGSSGMFSDSILLQVILKIPVTFG